jgi:phasin family protein
MFANPEQLAKASKANVDTMLTAFNAAFAGVERLTALNLNSARAALEDGVANAKALMVVNDIEDFIRVQSSFTQPAAKKAIDYSRSVYEICMDTGGQLSRLSEDNLAVLNKNLSAVVEEAAKAAPVGSEPAVAAIKTALETAHTAYETVSKAAKQVAEIAEANVHMATDAAVKAVGAVTGVPKAKKAA